MSIIGYLELYQLFIVFNLAFKIPKVKKLILVLIDVDVNEDGLTTFEGINLFRITYNYKYKRCHCSSIKYQIKRIV